MLKHYLAFTVFLVLPSSFWGGVFYNFVDPNAGRAAFLVMAIAGAYTCIKGWKTKYKCPNLN